MTLIIEANQARATKAAQNLHGLKYHPHCLFAETCAKAKLLMVEDRRITQVSFHGMVMTDRAQAFAAVCRAAEQEAQRATTVSLLMFPSVETFPDNGVALKDLAPEEALAQIEQAPEDAAFMVFFMPYTPGDIYYDRGGAIERLTRHLQEVAA